VMSFIEHGIGLDFPNTDQKIRFVGTTPLFVNQTFPNSTPDPKAPSTDRYFMRVYRMNKSRSLRVVK